MAGVVVVALLGVMKAGGAYVPLDPALPGARLAYMLQDSGAKVLVTGEPLLDAISAPPGGVVFLDLKSSASGGLADRPEPCSPAPGQLAYVIYTSGSTGRPKGVALEHG